MANKKKLPKLEGVLDRGQCDFGEELFTSPAPVALNSSRLDVMNTAFAELASAIAELGDLEAISMISSSTGVKHSVQK